MKAHGKVEGKMAIAQPVDHYGVEDRANLGFFDLLALFQLVDDIGQICPLVQLIDDSRNHPEMGKGFVEPRPGAER